MATMRASIQVINNALFVKYQVKNQTASEIYLTNLAVRMDPEKGPVLDPGEAFVYLEEQELGVHVTKRMPPPPKRLVRLQPHFVIPLKPGETFEEALELPLPLSQNIPYVSESAAQGEKMIVEFKRVLFSLGYVESSPKIMLEQRNYQGEDVFSLVTAFDAQGNAYPFSVIKEKYLVSDPVEVNVPVIRWK